MEEIKEKYSYRKEAALEIIDSMQYEVIGKLTKFGNRLIYSYFKELQEENTRLRKTQDEVIKYINEKLDFCDTHKEYVTCKVIKSMLVGDTNNG